MCYVGGRKEIDFRDVAEGPGIDDDAFDESERSTYAA